MGVQSLVHNVSWYIVLVGQGPEKAEDLMGHQAIFVIFCESTYQF